MQGHSSQVSVRSGDSKDNCVVVERIASICAECVKQLREDSMKTPRICVYCSVIGLKVDRGGAKEASPKIPSGP